MFILAHLHGVDAHPERVSNYKKHGTELSIENIQFPMKIIDIPNFEQLNNLNINIYDLTSFINFPPTYINKNY